MNVSDKLKTWLETSDRPVGSVVHTIDGKTPVRAEHTEHGWEYREEGWVHEG